MIVTAHDEYADIDFYGLNIPVVDTRNIVAAKSGLFYKVYVGLFRTLSILLFSSTSNLSNEVDFIT